MKKEILESCCDRSAPSRRAVLSGVMGAAGLMWANRASASGHAEVLLLTCMDYRLMNEIEAYMTSRGLRDDYDHLIVAGASIGVNRKPEWAAVFWEHLDLAIKLHSERKVLVLDHVDCGAYKLLLGEAAVATPELAMEAHTKELNELYAQLRERHPELEVELGVMDLAGVVLMVEPSTPPRLT